MKHFPAAAILLSTVLACAGASASAATLNFGSLGSGNLGRPSAILPEAQISGTGTILYTNEYFVGDGGSICSAFTTSTSTSCTGDLEITFASPVYQLHFEAIGYQQGDSVTISAFAADGSGLGNPEVVEDNKGVDFSALNGVTRLFFADHSSASGLAFGKFSFTFSPIPVPEPASGLMMVLGLAALGSLASHRRPTSPSALILRQRVPGWLYAALFL